MERKKQWERKKKNDWFNKPQPPSCQDTSWEDRRKQRYLELRPHVRQFPQKLELEIELPYI